MRPRRGPTARSRERHGRKPLARPDRPLGRAARPLDLPPATAARRSPARVSCGRGARRGRRLAPARVPGWPAGPGRALASPNRLGVEQGEVQAEARVALRTLARAVESAARPASGPPPHPRSASTQAWRSTPAPTEAARAGDCSRSACSCRTLTRGPWARRGTGLSAPLARGASLLAASLAPKPAPSPVNVRRHVHPSRRRPDHWPPESGRAEVYAPRGRAHLPAAPNVGPT